MVIQIPKRNHVQCINDQGCIIISDKMCIKTMREIEFIRFNVSNHVVTRGIRFTTKPCYLLLVSILWLFHKFHSNNQIASILPFNLSSKIKYSFLIIKWQRPIQSLHSPVKQKPSILLISKLHNSLPQPNRIRNVLQPLPQNPALICIIILQL